MRDDDIDAASQCIAHTFTKHEPITSLLQIDAADFRIFAAATCRQIIAQSLSVVAEYNSEIVGVRLAAKRGSYQSLHPHCKKMQFISAFLRALHDTAPFKINNNLTCLHLIMMGVAEEYHNRGIAQQLLQFTLENAKSRGFHSAIAEATSPVTQHIFLNKFGFALINNLAYKNFRHENQTMLQSMPDETPTCALLEKYL
jgi:GNAT superfamily N-acetyltransferase